MSTLKAIVAGVVLAVTGNALALPQSAFWSEVPVVDDPGDSSDLTGFRSFDLFVTFDPGDIIYAQDFGVAGPNDGLNLSPGQDFYQHEFGSDKAVNPDTIDFFPDLAYDTRGQMGDRAWDEYTLPAGPILWGTNGPGDGFWGVTAGETVTPASPDVNGDYWFARVTVSSVGGFGEQTSGLGEYLGGELFVSGEGPLGDFGMFFPPDGVVSIPNAFDVPSPGVGATLGLLAGGMLIRRRR